MFLSNVGLTTYIFKSFSVYNRFLLPLIAVNKVIMLFLLFGSFAAFLFREQRLNLLISRLIVDIALIIVFLVDDLIQLGIHLIQF